MGGGKGVMRFSESLVLFCFVGLVCTTWKTTNQKVKRLKRFRATMKLIFFSSWEFFFWGGLCVRKGG